MSAERRTGDATSAAVAASSDGNTTEATDWQARRDAVLCWLPGASRADLERFAVRHFDLAESAAYLIAEGHRQSELTAQRMASYAVSAALDWGAQSRRPSHATLQRRRAVA